MARAIDVARCFVRLASIEEEPDFLTHLRLQKLLYYAQAWSLVQRGGPLFPERIEAWVHGPVVREVFSAFKQYGDNVIPPNDVEDCGLPRTLEDPVESLTPDEHTFVASVWESYKGFSASKLREMTHGETPWIAVREGLPPLEKGEREITHESLRKYFGEQ